jgi:hypothetical protein
MKKRFIYFHNNLWKGLVWRLEEEWCNGLGPPSFYEGKFDKFRLVRFCLKIGPKSILISV